MVDGFPPAGFLAPVEPVDFPEEDEDDESLPSHAAAPVNTITISVAAATCRICMGPRVTYEGRTSCGALMNCCLAARQFGTHQRPGRSDRERVATTGMHIMREPGSLRP